MNSELTTQSSQLDGNKVMAFQPLEMQDGDLVSFLIHLSRIAHVVHYIQMLPFIGRD